jgi:GINS complex subunit 1
MSLYSEAGLSLCRDVKRSDSIPLIPPYREDTINDIIAESRYLTKQLSSLSQQLKSGTDSADAINVSAAIHECALRRNKRVLLVYSASRFEKLKTILWSLGCGSGSIQIPQKISKNMAPHELKLKKRYQDLIGTYRASMGDLELGSNEDVPPLDAYLEVRVLVECGQVLTEEGIVAFSKGSMHHLKLSQVEKLIKSGYLMHVD